MYLVKQTLIFSKWLLKLKDIKGRVAVVRRIERLKQGHFGDVKAVGGNVSEFRITTGPGYRVYFTQQDDVVVILLVGGDKSTQSKDIAKAKEMQKELEDEK